MGAHLERGLAPGQSELVEAEPGIEEARVVRSQLAAGRVVGRHLGRVLGRDRHTFGRQQQVELLGLEHHLVAPLAHDRLPVVGRDRDRPMTREIEQPAVALRAVADDSVTVAAVGEVEAEEHALVEMQLRLGHAQTVTEQDRMASMRHAQLVVIDHRPSVHQPQLVERETRMHLDRERARDDLEVQPPAVARTDLVESVAVVGEQAGEHVDAPGGALRVRLAADLRRQVELLEQAG